MSQNKISIRSSKRSLRNAFTAGNRRRSLGAAIEALECRRLLAFDFSVLTNINVLGVSSDPEKFVEIGNQVFFTADDGIAGPELFVASSNGDNVERVSDIRPGPIGSQIDQLAAVGDTLYFTASDDGFEPDLWKSDGTTAGTMKVFDADVGDAILIDDLTGTDSRLFFTAYQDSNGYELWTSDGSAGGTVLVRDIHDNSMDSDGNLLFLQRPSELTAVGDALFFVAADDLYNAELWKSDGTTSGTVLVADLDGSTETSSYPGSLTESNGSLYFSATTNLGEEPFRVSGASGSPVALADINPGSGDSSPRDFTSVGSETFFVANPGSGDQLYVTSIGNAPVQIADNATSDDLLVPNGLTAVGNDLFFVAGGTAVPGPIAVNAPETNPNNSFSLPDNNGNFGGRFGGVSEGRAGQVDQGFFRFGEGSTAFYNFGGIGGSNDGPGFPQGPGTFGSSSQIGDPGIGLTSVEAGDLVLRNYEDNAMPTQLFFQWIIEDPAGLSDIRFDGFASGNQFNGNNEGLVFQLFLNDVLAEQFTVTGSALDNYFGTRDEANLSFAASGGLATTRAEVRMSFGVNNTINDVVPDGSNEAIIVGATLSATGQTSGTSGRELHHYDGSTVTMVTDIVEGASSTPANLTAVGSDLLLTANDPVNGIGRELFVVDTTATTLDAVLLADLRPGVDAASLPLSSDPRDLITVGDGVYFSAIGPGGDRELHFSDATTSGTGLAANLNTATEGSDPEQLVVVGDTVFFVARDGVGGDGIYSVGPSGTSPDALVQFAGDPTDRIVGLTALPNGRLLFAHTSEGIYRYDPTTEVLLELSPTVPVINDGTVFEILGSIAYFSASSPDDGVELWRTNGNSLGTFEAADVNPGQTLTDPSATNPGSNPSELTVFNNRLYFTALTSVGRELYTYTNSGNLALVADLYPGNSSSTPFQLTVSGDHLFFSALDGRNNGGTGRELYSVDTSGDVTLINLRQGTTSGNINSRSSNPGSLTDIDGTLYFSAFDDTQVEFPAGSGMMTVTGFELFRSDGTVAGTQQIADVDPGLVSSNPSDFFGIGDDVYFVATTEANGAELFVNEIATGNTSIVADLRPGPAGSDPDILAELSGGRVLVSASANNLTGNELFVAGGPLVGLVPLLELMPGPSPSDPAEFTVLPVAAGEDRLLFVGNSPQSGREILELNEFGAAVDEVVINNGETQRSKLDSIDVLFNSRVDINGAAFEIENVTSGTMFEPIVAIDNTDPSQTIARLSFPAAGLDADGRIPDAAFVLRIDGTFVTSFGAPLEGNSATTPTQYEFGTVAEDSFYRFFGDIDGSRDVVFQDFLSFRQTFGLSDTDPLFNPAFDFDGDGTVAFSDFLPFRSNFGSGSI